MWLPVLADVAGLPWHKADNAAILSGMSAPYPNGYKVPLWLAMTEARAVVYLDVRKDWPVRRLEERWGIGRTQIAKMLKDVEAEYADACGQKRTSSGQVEDKNGHATASDSHERRDERTKSDAERTTSGHLARARSIPEKIEEVEKTTPTRAEDHEEDRQGQGPGDTAPPPRERPRFEDNPRPEAAPTPAANPKAVSSSVDRPKFQEEPPEVPNPRPTFKPRDPEDIIDLPAFVDRWDEIAEELRPGVASVRWDGDTVVGRKRGTFRSVKDDGKILAVYEAGRYLMPMLERYAECCRGKWGPSAHRAFERPDFLREINRLQLWVEKGAPPFYVKVAPPPPAVATAPQNTGRDGWIDPTPTPPAEKRTTVNGEPLPPTIRPTGKWDVVKEGESYFELQVMNGRKVKTALFPTAEGAGS